MYLIFVRSFIAVGVSLVPHIRAISSGDDGQIYVFGGFGQCLAHELDDVLELEKKYEAVESINPDYLQIVFDLQIAAECAWLSSHKYRYPTRLDDNNRNVQQVRKSRQLRTSRKERQAKRLIDLHRVGLAHFEEPMTRTELEDLECRQEIAALWQEIRHSWSMQTAGSFATN